MERERNKTDRSLDVFKTASFGDSNQPNIVQEVIETYIPEILPERPTQPVKPQKSTTNNINGITIGGIYFSISNIISIMILFVLTINSLKK